LHTDDEDQVPKNFGLEPPLYTDDEGQTGIPLKFWSRAAATYRL